MSHLHKCDEIVVVSRGEIVDQGPYDELMNKSKTLRELVQTISTERKESRAGDTGMDYIDQKRLLTVRFER